MYVGAWRHCSSLRNWFSAQEYEESWAEWHCAQKGNHFLCVVDPSFIEDQFNLYGLRSVTPKFRNCLELMLDVVNAEESEPEEWTGPLYAHTRDLYGLIHARFILTSRGMNAMLAKYRKAEFGVCPLLGCSSQPVLPIGLHSELRQGHVHVFCPRCRNVYAPSTPPAGSQRAVTCDIDGAYIGPTFPHLLILAQPAINSKLAGPKPFEPKVFGFRVYDGRFDVELRAQRSSGSSAAAAITDAKPQPAATGKALEKSNADAPQSNDKPNNTGGAPASPGGDGGGGSKGD